MLTQQGIRIARQWTDKRKTGHRIKFLCYADTLTLKAGFRACKQLDKRLIPYGVQRESEFSTRYIRIWISNLNLNTSHK